MKKSLFLIALLATSFALTITSCSSNDSKETEEVKETSKQTHACPMECEGEKTYTASGECPKCGMGLIEVE